MPNHGGGTIFVSELVALHMMGSSINAAAVDAVLNDMQTGNPSFVGWSFEFAGVGHLLKAIKGSKTVTLIAGGAKEPTTWPLEQLIRVDFGGRHSQAITEKSCVSLTSLSLATLENGSLLLPFAWNQGCFDAVLVRKGDNGHVTLNFLQFTRAKQHSLKLRFIASVLSHLGDVEVRRQMPARACSAKGPAVEDDDIKQALSSMTVMITIVEPDSQHPKVGTNTIGSLDPFPHVEPQSVIIRGVNDVKSV